MKGASRAGARLYELVGVGAAARAARRLARARALPLRRARRRRWRTLEAALERALAGEAAVVGIVGEAGRRQEPPLPRVRRALPGAGIPSIDAHGRRHGKAVPLLPLLELHAEVLRHRRPDDDERAREKIAGRLLLLDPELRDDAAARCSSSSACPTRTRPGAADRARRRVQRQLLEIDQAAASRRRAREPRVGRAVEDLHWFDPASEALLGDARSGVAAATRTLGDRELPARVPGADWMASRDFRRLPLAPARPRGDGASCCATSLGADPSLGGARERLIRERTGGNPFFIEEVVRTLVEAGSLVGRRAARTGSRAPVERDWRCRPACRRSSPRASTGCRAREGVAPGRGGDRQGVRPVRHGASRRRWTTRSWRPRSPRSLAAISSTSRRPPDRATPSSTR